MARPAWLICVALACLVAAALPHGSQSSPVQPSSAAEEQAARLTVMTFPYDRVAEPLRPRVEAVLKQPTVYARGPIEAFPCQPSVYGWLLDHPHLGFRAWKALGVKCARVEQRDDGTFYGVDPSGSELTCTEVLREPNRRVWFAEGVARPAVIGPSFPLRAVLLLRHHEVIGADGRTGVRHRAEVFAQYDANRAAKIISQLWNMTDQTVARRAAEQVELFFSGLAWYISENPTWPATALQPQALPSPRDRDQLASLQVLLTSLPAPPAEAPRK